MAQTSIGTERFKCHNCGKVFTFFGEDAKTIKATRHGLSELYKMYPENVIRLRVTVLDIINIQATCCKDKFIVHYWDD